MNTNEITGLTTRALETGRGILRLMPAWVPRSFCVPGRRLRLHPNDLYALGAQRGGIDERWLASTAKAENGPLTPPDEGLSYVYVNEGSKVLLRDAVAELGADLLGQEAMAAYGGWVMFGKFFDNMYPLPFHLHQSDAFTADTGQLGKPEAYYFPAQYNPTLNTFPYTFFGFEPGTTRDAVIACLKRWNEGDNGILGLSRAYRLDLGDAWYIPPGVLHAPGTLCTYEPQRASDVSSIWQSLVADSQVFSRDLLVTFVPKDKHDDYDYLISLLDWEGNTDPAFRDNYFLPPQPAFSPQATADQGYGEHWIVYGNAYFSAKELSVLPGRTVTVRDAAAYGLICVQGYGRLGGFSIAAPTMIRFGQMTEDEFFVTAHVARQGVEITNLSPVEPLVILKHFNPGNPETPPHS